jgi:hypothetical protein
MDHTDQQANPDESRQGRSEYPNTVRGVKLNGTAKATLGGTVRFNQ